MSHLSKINIQIKEKPLRGFQHVVINQNLYGIDSFQISCRYDALEDFDEFLIQNSKDLLGAPVFIQTKFKTKDEEKEGITFKGFVTEIQSNRSGLADADQIIISGGSQEIMLNRKPANRAFLDKTIKEIVEEVLCEYPLKWEVKTRNNQKYPYIVQFEESDLEFLKRLSIRYGEWFFFNGDTVIFGEIPVTERELTLGYNLKNFRYGLKVQPVKFTLFALDPLTADVHYYKSGNKKVENNLNEYGKYALKKSKEVYPLESKDYYEHLNVNEQDFKKGLEEVGEIIETADAVNLNDLSGSSTNGFISAGDYVKINCIKQDGKTKLDCGRYLITSVGHNMDRTLHYSNSFSAIPGKTSIPENTNPYYVRTTSNQIGLVADNKDPGKLGRVRISFRWMEDRQMTPWVRVITPYVMGKGGFYFVPAQNSRVVVGFEDGDVEKPYCLGALFDEQGHPDPNWAGNYNDNNAKIHAIRTRSGQTIELHDESGKEKIIIYDLEGNNTFELDQANKSINITTKGSMNIAAGGTLKINAKTIEISADSNLKMDVGATIEQNATDIKLSAVNVRAEADASLKASGTGNAEVSSSGVLLVKGSLVQIN